MQKILVLALVSLVVSACASSSKVAVSPATLQDGQVIVRQDKHDSVLSRKKLDVEMTALPYTSGEPMLLRVRIHNRTDAPVVFDPQNDIVVSLNNKKLKTWGPDDGVRPRSEMDNKVLGSAVLFTAIDIALPGRSRMPILTGLGVQIAGDMEDEKFKNSMLKSGSILSQEWVTGYLVADSYTDDMIVQNQPGREDDPGNKSVVENFKGRIDVSVRVADEYHTFSFDKKQSGKDAGQSIASAN